MHARAHLRALIHTILCTNTILIHTSLSPTCSTRLGDIDSQNLSLGRLTVKALRTLYKVGSINKDHKDKLLAEMIESVDYEKGTSKVEVAFDLLVLRAISEKDRVGTS